MTTLKIKSMFIVFRLLLIIMVFLPIRSYAGIESEISISSKPVRAKVFLLQGTKQTLIGTTPFIYKAGFHSDKSVIRMSFSKSGYKHHELKISASQKNVSVSLELFPLMEDPSFHKTPRNRQVQKKINAAIEPIIRGLLDAPDLADIDSVDPIRIKEIGDHLYVVLSLSMIRPKEKIRNSAALQREDVVQKSWGQLGKSLFLPLAEKTRGIDGIEGGLMKVRFESQYTRFNVGHNVETTSETKCVPGYRYELSTDFYGKQVTRTIYEPCLHRKTETKTKVKFDPAVDRGKGKSTIQYYLPFKELEKKYPENNIFEKVGVVYTNSKGNELFRKGSLPTELEQVEF